MKHHLNLLPESSRRREHLRGTLKFWSAATVIVVIGLVFLAIKQWNMVEISDQKLQAVSRKFEPTRRLQAEWVRHQKRLEEVQAMRERTYDIERRHPFSTLLALLSHAVAETENRVCIVSLTLSSTPANNSMSIHSDTRVVLKGIGIDNSVIADFTNHLETSGLFHSVDLNATHLEEINEYQARQFEIVFTY